MGDGRLTPSLHNTLEVTEANVWSHWTTLHQPTSNLRTAFNQIDCQNCAVWTSRTILSKPILCLLRK
jgi:hypothetical protein